MSHLLSAEQQAVAAVLFGDRLDLAVRYAQLLTTIGVERGLIGPREAPRIWDRHLFNCAVVGELLPRRSTIIDVGSGAGLPGLVVGIARPDLTLTLLEPQQRRVDFLSSVISELGLVNVEVDRGRAEERANEMSAPVVMARAVAPLDRLAAWCFPLLSRDGKLLALKGESAKEELARSARALRKLGVKNSQVIRCGEKILHTPTTVVQLSN